MLSFLLLSSIALAAPAEFVGSFSGTIANEASSAPVAAVVDESLAARIFTGEGLVVSLGVCGTHVIEPRDFEVMFTLEGDVARGRSTWPIAGLNLPMTIEAVRSPSGLDATVRVDAPFFCGDVVFSLELDRS
jgi:hypothetical protein